MRIGTQDTTTTDKRQHLTMQRKMALDTLIKSNSSNLNMCNGTSISGRTGVINECNITINIRNATIIDVPVWKALDFGAAPYRITENSVIYGGVEISNKDLPIFDLSDCKDVKAIDNYVYFEKGEYYKSTNKDGEFYVMACQPGLGQPCSEFLKKGWCKDANDAGSFWGLLSQARSVSYYYSNEEITSYLEKADVKPGFFTVDIAGKSVEYYYSPDTPIMLLTKAEYDSEYSLLTNESGTHNVFHVMPIGSIFKVDGKEYVMDENYSIDIPYGINLLKIEYPKNIYEIELENHADS